MSDTRQEAIKKLLKSYEAYYNIEKYDTGQLKVPLVARCDYFEHSQKYVMSQKAELWSADSEEFLYLFDVTHLTKQIYEDCMAYALQDGQQRMHIGPGHMYTYITVNILCDRYDTEAKKALRKSRFYKSFHFSLHGWLDYHAAAVQMSDQGICCNYAGRSTAKILKKVLFHTKKKRSVNK